MIQYNITPNIWSNENEAGRYVAGYAERSQLSLSDHPPSFAYQAVRSGTARLAVDAVAQYAVSTDP